ncbi:amidohydrolase [Microlunatus endophyticus]|uniref:Amidohydrolase n=1 Tax=Microlunatus endophyticus TaxID=1716077 RepID=A0A917SA79_9ACTN|nr:amidohydrolase family protein [Microlunatus endophyticus]GGL67185.1 amidohydrolase [Microlunatus endophyticus]
MATLGSQRLHLTGAVLPDGERRELWLADGLVRTEPVRDAVDLEGGYILPGLVDAHCHVGLEAHGPVSDEIAEQHALADRAAGALLLRSPGSPTDTRWMDDRADLPKLIRAGHHIARPKRYIRNYADEVEPEDLIAAVEAQVPGSDGWIKLVGDWIDRGVGDLAPLWPAEVVKPAIDRAHELGLRVTAHVFGEQAAAELVEAGIDGIEHGTGITGSTIALMAERQVALVPTMIQLENFETFAAQGEAKFPTYAAHMRALYASRLERFRDAYDAGVPIYAGTDAGGYQPHGRIGDEVIMLAELFGADYALGAACWQARSWLGRPDALSEGAEADLVVFDEDPRSDLRILARPRHVILRGSLVETAGGQSDRQ